MIHEDSAVAGRVHKPAVLVVAFMKLFLRRGFVLDPVSTSYGDDVVKTGREAETNMLASTQSQGVSKRLCNGLLKQMRELLCQSKLDAYIRSYKELHRLGLISDPARKEDTLLNFSYLNKDIGTVDRGAAMREERHTTHLARSARCQFQIQRRRSTSVRLHS